jgi:hypothetical protein
MKKIQLFSFLIITCFGAMGQQFDFTVIDNSDYVNIQKYKVQNCLTYKTIDSSSTRVKALINASFFNRQGLNTKEIEYKFPNMAIQWILTAQYSSENVVIGEQWRENKYLIDSTAYTYNSEGQLIKSCIKCYFKDSLDMVLCDTFAYENGIRKNLTHPEVVDSYSLEKADSVIHYYLDGRIKQKLIGTKKIISYHYDLNKKLIRVYHSNYNASGDLVHTLVKNQDGVLLEEINRSYNGTLLLKIETNNLQLKLKSSLEFVYTYYD